MRYSTLFRSIFILLLSASMLLSSTPIAGAATASPDPQPQPMQTSNDPPTLVYSYAFDPPEISTQCEFADIVMADTSSMVEIGRPELPMRTLQLLLPQNSRLESVVLIRSTPDVCLTRILEEDSIFTDLIWRELVELN